MRWLALLAIAALSLAKPLLAAELTRHDVALLNRLTWGINASSVANFVRSGSERWLSEQLQAGPTAMLPRAADEQLNAMTNLRRPAIDLVTDFDRQARTANQISDPEQKKAAQQAYQQAMNDLARQAAAQELLRALYSSSQVRERMVWFWFNHFNVHQYKANLRVLVGDYVDHAVRPYALGRFRNLLAATLRHPAMLRYLDNAENAVGHINENYAREIMELHTMGVGSGYGQKDVEELSRILTGFGLDSNPQDPKLKSELQTQLIRDGLFEFNPQRHDYGDKTFLGHSIKGRGSAEVDEALDILSRHPATAAFVSRKIATYFVSDTPPQALIQRLVDTFQKSDGDIAAVLLTMVRSPEFAASLDNEPRYKDPIRYVLSTVRFAYDDKVILNTAPIQNWLNRLGEGMFNRATPDGYPLIASAWNGPGQMIVRFEIARQMGSGSAGLFKPEGPNTLDQPAFPVLQNQLYFNVLHSLLSPATTSALSKAVSPQDWNTLYLSSPEFMY